MAFSRRNQPKACSVCGKLTADNSGIVTDELLCASCRELADLENEHLDGYHRDAPDKRCPQCVTLLRVVKRAKNPPQDDGYYIWAMNRRGEVVGQSIIGPIAVSQARARAASFARRSQLDRAVSRGADPRAKDFSFVAAYEAGTGRKMV